MTRDIKRDIKRGIKRDTIIPAAHPDSIPSESETKKRPMSTILTMLSLFVSDVDDVDGVDDVQRCI